MSDQESTVAESAAEVLVRACGLVLFGVGTLIWIALAFERIVPAELYPQSATLFAGLFFFGYGLMAKSRLAAKLLLFLTGLALAANAISGFSGTGGRYFAGLAFLWSVLAASIGAAWRRLRWAIRSCPASASCCFTFRLMDAEF
jgi:hypothetical protein